MNQEDLAREERIRLLEAAIKITSTTLDEGSRSKASTTTIPSASKGSNTIKDI